jgi:hypothetical protein
MPRLVVAWLTLVLALAFAAGAGASLRAGPYFVDSGHFYIKPTWRIDLSGTGSWYIGRSRWLTWALRAQPRERPSTATRASRTARRATTACSLRAYAFLTLRRAGQVTALADRSGVRLFQYWTQTWRRPCRRRTSYQSAWTAVPLCSVATVPLAPHAITADRSGQLSIPSCQCLAMPAGDS